MPVYMITCILHDKKVIKGFREEKSLFIEQVWVKYKVLAERSYGLRLKSFSLVQIAKQSPEYLSYIRSQGRQYPPRA